MRLHIATLALAICLIPTLNGQIDLSGLQQQVNVLTNDILGVSEYQNYLNTITYSASTQTHQDILQTLKSEISSTITERVLAVRALRDKIQDTFLAYSGTTAFGNCCQCCSTNDPYGRLKFKSEVDLETMCHTGQGTSSTSKQYPTNALLDVMKANFKDNPNLKWQYFGGEDGIMTIFPGNKACDGNFDPRFRSWYSHTAFRTPKDVVLVVDRSASMSNSFHLGRSLMDIAKDAANTVLDTLNPDDRVGVVFFSTAAETGTVCSDQLAEATPENKNTFKSYIDSQRGNGNTYYGRAFTKAFEFYGASWSMPAYDRRERLKVILFLTDGRPTEPSPSTYLDVIREKNAARNNEVVILTFGFGEGLEKSDENLWTIAYQNASDPSAGQITPGRYVYVDNPDNIRSSMATYYDFFSNGQPNISPSVAIPYVDAFGLGFITSLCLPVHTDDVFRGVTCIDITIADLFTDATYFSQNTDSYAFIVDSRGRLLLHPLLPRPSDVYEDPTLLHVLDIETEPEMTQVLELMLNRMPSTKNFRSQRVLSRGDSVHDGVNTDTIDSVYLWDNLGLDDLQVCVVLAERDKRTSVLSNRPVDDFPYHSLDLTQPSNTCRYINRVAITDLSTIKFAPFAFQSPEGYLEQMETAEIINLYEQYFSGSGDSSFKNDVKNALAISAQFDQVISKTETAWQSAIWRYLGLREGVFRLYPGTKLVTAYDNTNRPWYKRAVSQPGVTTFSKPYVDAFGAGIIITMSKALYEGKPSGGQTIGDPLAGVMGMDFTLDLFNSLLTSNIPQCSSKQCIAMDNAGYIISHPDFINVGEEGFSDIENVHISQKEKFIASELVNADFLREDQCINFRELKVQSFWRAIKRTHTAATFQLDALPGTNIFIIVKEPDQSSSGSCQCSVNGGLTIPSCDGSSCRCPCFSRDGVAYNPCDVSFTFDVEIGSKPPCNPPTPEINLASVAEREKDTIQTLVYCYDVDTVCPSRTSQLNCSATSGCRWCGNSCEVRTSDGCSDGDGGGNTTAIAVGVVVALLVIIIVVIVVVVCIKRKKPSPSGNTQSSSTSGPNVARQNSGASYAAGNLAYNPDYGVGNSQAPAPSRYDAPPSYGQVVTNPNF